MVMDKNSLPVAVRFVKLSLLLLFSIPATICALYVIYSFLKLPTFRRQFQNQILMILVMITLLNIIFDIPLIISFLVRGSALVHNKAFCHLWQFVDYLFTACIIWCTAIFTFQRYIFVFHPTYLRSQRQKIIFHYFPLIFINLYLILFYTLTTFIEICSHEINFVDFLCGHQCLDRGGSISMFNWFFNILFPLFVIIFGSLILLTRVLWTRRTMQRNLRNWSKNRKMTIQLLGISICYTLVWFPVAIVTMTIIFDDDNHVANIIEDYFYFVTYLCELTSPIAVVFVSSELRRNLCRCLRPSLNGISTVSIEQHSTN